MVLICLEYTVATAFEIELNLFSLEEVNRVEGKKHPLEREWSYGWSLMRLGAPDLEPELLALWPLSEESQNEELEFFDAEEGESP